MDFQKVRPCAFCGEEKEVKARGLCAACYQRLQRRGTPEYIKVRKPCVINDCDKLSQAHGLCATHLKRWQRHGNTEQTRKKGWGSKEKHPLYHMWQWRRRKSSSSKMCNEWVDDFWQFVQDVGEKPGNNYTLQRIDRSIPYSKENFEWREKYIRKTKTESQKEYNRRYQKKYRQTPHGKASLKNSSLKKTYGITLDEYESMREAQNNVCLICSGGKDKELAVDHCHITGKVRGLLCSRCNTGLGNFKDSIKLLTNAINYLNPN